MNARVTVVVPVGPFAVYKQWLSECLNSVRAQTYPADEVLLIDDMADLGNAVLIPFLKEDGAAIVVNRNKFVTEYCIKRSTPEQEAWQEDCTLRIWRAPWNRGDVGSFNCGVGLARNELVFLLSCDDMLEPECLELCVAEWEKHERRDAVYYVGTHIIGCEGEKVAPDQTDPFGNAMVTKGLWQMTGGFLPGYAMGDWLFLQILGKNFPDRCFPVDGARVLYSARTHDQSLTIRRETGAPPRWPTEWGRVS